MIKYFDYNATTPLSEEIWEAMGPFSLRDFANPSSVYAFSRSASRALRMARKQVAALLGAKQDSEIVFTSGGTESNNMAIRSAMAAQPSRRRILTSAVEHSSVLRVCQAMEREGYQLITIPVDRSGRLDLDRLRAEVSDQVALASFMYANNETGVLFQIPEIRAILDCHQILFHVDAVQAAGKLILDAAGLGVDYLSVSAHKFYGPKGIGALYIREGIPCRSLIGGGSQEYGRRAGTENVPGIVGLGIASERARQILNQEQSRLENLRDFFEMRLKDELKNVSVNGAEAPRLCNTSNVMFPGISAEALLIALDQRGVCVSSGSACMSGSAEPSHVLTAMGLSRDQAKSCLRFSFGKQSTVEDVEDLVFLLKEAVSTLTRVSEAAAAAGRVYG